MTLAEAPDRLQHVIDVRHHGAFFAGGSAAENAATLTAAITAASTAPVKAAVKLPSGLFNVDNSSVIVLPQNVGLTGDGVLYGGNTRGTILNGTDDTKEVIRLGSANSSGQTYKEGFVLENLRITGGLYGIACRNGVAHLDMHRVEIASQADNGAAVRVDGWLEKVRAEHCWFYGPTGGYGWYNANVTAQNGTRYLDKTSFYDCHFLGGTNTARFMGQMDAVLFVGCAFNSSTSHGIVIDGNTTQVNFLNCSSEAVGQGAKSNRTTGTISSGLASLVLASATGYAQGDSVVVKGAGANGVDLFATISTLVGTTATLDTTASTKIGRAHV